MTRALLAVTALAALGALATSSPLLVGDNVSALFDESYGLVDYMKWPGPQRGCAEVEGAGDRELQLECSLPAGRVVLVADRAASYVSLKCEAGADGRAGGFTCGELQEFAGVALGRYTREASMGHDGAQRRVRRFSVDGCALSESLRCVLALVAAGDALTLELKDVPGPLTPDHLRGFSAVAHLRIVDIGQNVSRLPYEALAEFPALRRLDVHGGALRLPAGGDDWRPLRRLAMLELTMGGLRSVPAQAFSGLAELRNLSLWMNEIEELDENALKGLTQLECLSLNSNKLTRLPEQALLATPLLRLLHLYDNRITTLPRLGHLRYLEEVWVNNKNKSVLLLDNDTFAGLPALRKLKLESCGLAALPEGLLRGCSALADLMLSGNRLTDLPSDLLAEQGSLRVMDLSRNRLRTMSSDLLAGARALVELNLGANAIELLPTGVFRNLVALYKLDLSHNNIRDLHSEVFRGLNGISELNLSYNNLTLDAAPGPEGRRRSPLAHLTSLNRLTLAHNSVRYFAVDWADELLYLESLDLSYNDIAELSHTDLQLLSAALVDVRHNNIARVGQLSAAELRAAGGRLSRARFLLGDNPFLCDCDMYDFLEGLRIPSVKPLFDLQRALCEAPPPLAGALLTDTAPDALVCPLPERDCAPGCCGVLRPANRSVELDCEGLPTFVPRYPEAVVRLRLRTPLADVAALPDNVRILNLSGLNLTSPPGASGRSLPDLTVDLSDNRLTSAPLALLEANCQVRLAGNPLSCDCEHRASVASLLQYWARVVDGDGLRCGDRQWLKGMDAEALCAGRDALALGLGSGLAVALLVLLVFRYRTEVRLLLGRFQWFDFLLPEKAARMLEKKYDAFVSFSHCDDAFVRDVLVPQLETRRRPLRLCLHYRDWEVGGYIPDQIHRSVEQSWRTVVVLSEDFVKSVWGRHEFRAAHSLERVIVLVLGDALAAMDAEPELRAYKKTHTYILASDPLVWDRIRDAVYRSRRAAPAPSPPPDKGTKGGLDVHLRDGKLVNEAAKHVNGDNELPLPLRNPARLEQK